MGGIMAWNEPGNSNNNDDDKDKNRNQDPWGGPPKKTGGDGGPPDLDEVFAKLKELFNKLLGGNNKRFSSNKPQGSGGNEFTIPLLPILLVVVLAIVGIWLSKAIYIVDQQEEAIILRFGKYQQTVKPGLHLYLPPMDTKFQINVTAVRTYSNDKSNPNTNAKHSQMLTSDENIVEIPLTVQYRIVDLKSFILANDAPERVLENATDSALRQIAGSMTMNDILTKGRTSLQNDVQVELVEMLKSYNTGIVVDQVNIQSASAPAEVQSAFDDVIKAREEEQQLKNEAQAYENSIIPIANGEAARLKEESIGYRDALINRATGEAERFEKLLAAYQEAPKVTKERLYIETLQEVLTKTSKIFVSSKGGQNQLLYLPIDKLINSQSGTVSTTSATTPNTSVNNPASSYMPTNNNVNQMPKPDLRIREIR